MNPIKHFNSSSSDAARRSASPAQHSQRITASTARALAENRTAERYREIEDELNCVAVDFVTRELTARGHLDREAPRSRIEQVYVDVLDTCTAVYREGFDGWMTFDFNLRATPIAHSMRLIGATKAARLVVRAARIHAIAESRREAANWPEDDRADHIQHWESSRLAKIDDEFFELSPSPMVLLGRFIRCVVTGTGNSWERVRA